MPLISIIAMATVTGLFGLAAMLLLRHSKGKGKGKKQRLSDRTKLSPHQKKIYMEARKLYKKGNFRSSAKMLESLGMVREAVNIFEKGKLIHEAADVLMRIHRPNRAGVVYVRHGLYKEAMECFKIANMPKDVAACACKIGDLKSAVVYFLEAKEYNSAAECYGELGKHREAAKLYIKIGMEDKAIQEYNILASTDTDFEKYEFSDREIQVIVHHLADGDANIKLADILVVQKHVIDLILAMLGNGDIEKARLIYKKAPFDIGPTLIGNQDLDDEGCKALADLFEASGDYNYSGMICERLGDFARAGLAFEKNNNFQRAAYCFDRAGMEDKASAMHSKFEALSPMGQAKAINTPDSKANKLFKMEETNALEHDKQTHNGSGNSYEPFLISLDDHLDSEVSGAKAKIISLDELKKNTPPESSKTARGEGPKINKVPYISLAPRSASLNLGNADAGLAEPGNPQVQDSDYWSGLHNAKFLTDLTTEQQSLLKSIGQVKEFQANEYILDYADEPLGLYFILKGRVKVYKKLNGIDTEIDIMESPETIGQLWLLMDRPTKVKFVALKECRLFAIKRADFLDLLDKNGTIARKVYKRFTMTLLEKLLSIHNEKEKLEVS